MQLVAYFSRVGRICPTSVIGRQVGAEFFGENPSLGGSEEQVGRRGFGSPGNSEVRITVFPLPEHVLSSSVSRPPSRNCLDVLRRFRAVSLGEWESCAGLCRRLASLCCLIPGSREPRCALHHRVVGAAARRAQGSCPSGHVDRAPRGDAGGVFRASVVSSALE